MFGPRIEMSEALLHVDETVLLVDTIKVPGLGSQERQVFVRVCELGSVPPKPVFEFIREDGQPQVITHPTRGTRLYTLTSEQEEIVALRRVEREEALRSAQRRLFENLE